MAENSSVKSTSCPPSFKRNMVWTEKHDMLLCREIITTDPFTDIKKGTTQRSAKWAAIAEALVAVKDIDVPFRVDKRAVRDRYNLLAERMRTKIKNEEKASGISPTRSEVEEALEYLIEKEDASDEIQKNNMNRKDDVAEREKAEEVRKVAMESLGTTKRRKEDEKENSVDCKQPKRRRSAGSETVAYLREKSEKERQGRVEENELKKAQLELEQKKHNDVLQMLQQQQHQQQQTQQQQMQAFAMLFQQQQQQQQQQAELFLKLFEKLEKK